jgi:myo-inositol-1(or 4)-monophosphatase
LFLNSFTERIDAVENLTILLETAEQLAVDTGQLIRRKWSQPRKITNKGFRDFLTDTDIEAQKLITDAIQERFPTHGFLTEETDGELPSKGPIIWVIDPVDGTTNFSRSVPTFCVSIAAVSETADVLAGAVYDPMRDELFSAAKGSGAWMQQQDGERRQLQTSEVNDLHDTLFGLDWSREPALRRKAVQILAEFSSSVTDIRAVGSAALALSWVAAGRVDGYVNLELCPWDLAAASLLISEAGGRLSDLTGQTWGYTPNASGCVASNGRIHQALLTPLTRLI